MGYCEKLRLQIAANRALSVSVLCMIALVAIFYSHTVQAQSPSRIFVTESSCPQIGVWESNTCTLTGDVDIPLIIQMPGVSLDGSGYTVQAAAGLNDATISVMSPGVIIKNVVIRSTARSAINILETATGAVIENVIMYEPRQGVLVQAQDSVIRDVSVIGGDNTSFGLRILDTKNILVSEFTARQSSVGISVFDSSDVTISSSRIKRSKTGIATEFSDGLILEQSAVTDITRTGLQIGIGSEVAVRNNVIKGVSNSSSEGIRLTDTGATSNTIITGNDISNWDIGINDRTSYFTSGPMQMFFLDTVNSVREIIIPTTWAQVVARVSVYGNNFFENNIAYSIPIAASERVSLHQNTIGNYWDTYDEVGEGCVDSNDDQVCDAPYQLEASIKDDFATTEAFANLIAPIVSATCSLYVAAEVPGNQDINVRFTSVFADTIDSPDSVAAVDISSGSFAVIPTALGMQTISATVTGLGGASDCTATVLVTGEIPEPTTDGASSVLFLPGIMGSRLYEEGQQCNDFGVEQERWFSISDCEQLRLLTRFDGTSLNDIYTKAMDDAVIGQVALLSLYGSFIEQMNELEETEVIADFVPFPYDWRLQLDDLLKTTKDPVSGEVRYVVGTTLQGSHLYQTVEQMVNDSHNGNVSIVAHSNGGLLAKTFLSALQATNDPLADKIDNVILVASPQAGTPDAINGLLHGAEIGEGFVVSQEIARILLNTAPFGHHLLPNQNYFDGDDVSVRTPVITFKAGVATDDWRSTFGPEITSTSQLHQFLSKDSGRPVPNVDDLLQPQVVDNFLLNYTSVIKAVMDSWTPSTSTSVYQIAGTGIETASGITYFTDTECITGGFLWFECTQYAPKLGYYINFTHDGDKTVVVPSALAMKESDGIERIWLDLASADRVHNNIMEVSELSTYITDIIQSDAAPALPSDFSSSPIIPDVGRRLSFFLHSPLDMYVESSAGITSSSTDDLTGVTYRRYGEVQYVSVPADSTDLVLQLRGYQSGSFTLVMQEWDGRVLTATENFEAIPTGPATIIELPLDGFNMSTSLDIDFDGDGVVDGVVSAQTDRVVPVGKVIEVGPPVVIETPENVSSSGSSATRLGQRSQATPSVGQVAGVVTSAGEQWYYQELLKILEQLAALLLEIEQQYENEI